MLRVYRSEGENFKKSRRARYGTEQALQKKLILPDNTVERKKKQKSRIHFNYWRGVKYTYRMLERQFCSIFWLSLFRMALLVKTLFRFVSRVLIM
jgi:hypothetical protein